MGSAGCVPKGSLAIRVGDELGPLFMDEAFADLFPARGRPAWSPGRLALVLVLQFVEGLTDRQAAEAVRARIDYKYALGLDLGDPEWFKRYATRAEDSRFPKAQAAGDAVGRRVGIDGTRLLEAVFSADTPRGLVVLPEVEILRQVWVLHFHLSKARSGGVSPKAARQVCYAWSPPMTSRPGPAGNATSSGTATRST